MVKMELQSPPPLWISNVWPYHDHGGGHSQIWHKCVFEHLCHIWELPSYRYHFKVSINCTHSKLLQIWQQILDVEQLQKTMTPSLAAPSLSNKSLGGVSPTLWTAIIWIWHRATHLYHAAGQAVLVVLAPHCGQVSSECDTGLPNFIML